MAYSTRDVITSTGIKPNQLNLLRRQGYINPSGIQRGGRQLFSYSEDDLNRIKEMLKLMETGISPRRAFDQVAATMGYPTTPDAAPSAEGAMERRLQPDADGPELGRLVEAIAIRQGMTPKNVLDTYESWAKALPESIRSQYGMDIGRPITSLEDAFAGRRYPYNFVRSLGFSLGVPTLLLDPVFTWLVPASTICLKLDRVFDFVPIGDCRDSEYGRGGTQYRIPWRRLPSTEGMLGTLTLEPKAASDAHLHSGEQLCLCLSGSATLNLRNSGIFTLGPGDYCHFEADQMHREENAGDRPAHLLILRLYQVHVESTKQKVVARWNELYKGDRLPPWLNPIAPKAAAEGASEVVQDLFGFGEFLKHIGQQRGRATIAERLRTRRTNMTTDECNAYLDALEAGLKVVTRAELAGIAEIYRVREILLHSFLSPAIPGAVVVRGLFEKSPLHNEFKRAADVGAEARYWLPTRNLRFSDLSLALIRLDSGEQTPPNDHPGTELLIPLEGTVTAHFPGEEVQAFSATAPREMLIYSSGRTHYGSNSTDQPAVALVIRFRSPE